MEHVENDGARRGMHFLKPPYMYYKSSDAKRLILEASRDRCGIEVCGVYCEIIG